MAIVLEGECEAVDFLRSLPDRAKVQFKARFEHLGETGRLRTPEFFRRIAGLTAPPPVYEFKVPHGPGYRLYCVRLGRDYVVTHGRKKPKDSRVLAEAKDAQRRIGRWEDRR